LGRAPARLLACEDEDGQWAGGAFVPRGFTERDWQAEGQPSTATAHVLDLLREFGAGGVTTSCTALTGPEHLHRAINDSAVAGDPERGRPPRLVRRADD